MDRVKPSTTKLRKSLRQELEENSNIQRGIDLQKQKEYNSIRFIDNGTVAEEELLSKACDVCRILQERDFECDVDFSNDPSVVSCDVVARVGVLVGFHETVGDIIVESSYRDAFYKFFRSALNEVGLRLNGWQYGGSQFSKSKCEIPYDMYTVSSREKTSSKETDKAFEEYKKTIKSLDDQYTNANRAESKEKQ